MTADPFAPWAWSRAEWARRAGELGQPAYRGRAELSDSVASTRYPDDRASGPSAR